MMINQTYFHFSSFDFKSDALSHLYLIKQFEAIDNLNHIAFKTPSSDQFIFMFFGFMFSGQKTVEGDMCPKMVC